jgi:hypothetical protein
MDRLATDMAAAQKRLAMIDQYLNLESAKVSKPNVPVASSAAAAKPASDQAFIWRPKKRLTPEASKRPGMVLKN